ncbi:MAG: hypothetical protein AUJ57_09945 [Zetaproteobacteria bacterium CG1_02_53_45]|nr:MAG: hypothetical protein AUJ57_09945 [Zetaproteobacteria bacterium CG1_02_53_45]
MTGSVSIHAAGRPEEQGFTLIEMMIGMAMGLIILAGLTMLFVSYSDSSRAMASRTERMADLYLASHVMQAGLRESVSNTAPSPAFPVDMGAGGRKPAGVCSSPNNLSVSLPVNYPASFPYYPYWDATSKTLTYQDLDGNTGVFQYQRTASDRIYWLRPDPCVSQFEELMRDLDVNTGMQVAIAGGVLTVSLTSSYITEGKKSSSLSLTFKTWPRN